MPETTLLPQIPILGEMTGPSASFVSSDYARSLENGVKLRYIEKEIGVLKVLIFIS